MSRDQVEAEVQDDDEKGQLLPDAEKGSGGGTLLEHDEEQRPLSPRQRAAGFARARLGLLMALGGTLTFSLMTVSVRLIPFFGPPVPVFLIVIVRGCIVTSSSLWSLCRRGISPLGPVPYRGWLVFRGSMGFTALSSYYYGLYHLRVADAVVLQKTTPILVCIIAALWLGEKFGPYDLGASLLCLGGVAMVVQSEDEPTPVDTSPTAAGQPAGRMSADVAAAAADPDEVDWVKVGAVLIVLGSALSSALAYTTIRKLKTDPRGLTVDPMVLVLYFAFICVPGGAVGLWLGEDAVPWAEVTIEQWAIIVFGCGMLGFVGQTLLNSSFQLESAGLAATMQYVEIVYAEVWGVLIFGENPPWQSICGAALVMCCALMTLLKKKEPVAPPKK